MDLTGAFRSVVSLSLLGSILVIGLCLIKLVFRRKLSATWHYYIWFVLLLRLLIPFTPTTSFSVLNIIPHYQQAIYLPQVSMPGSEGRAPTAAVKNDENSSNTMPGKSSGNETQPPLTTTAKSWFSWPTAALAVMTWFSWQTAALIWGTGLFVISLYILFVNGLLVFKTKRLPVCDSEETLRILRECKKTLNVRSEVSVVYDDTLKSPALFGLFSPKIIISPEVVNRLSPDELRYVFLHELSHLKRYDLLVNGLVLAVQIIYWFNPLIWYALHQMKQDCEMACDATALAALKPEDHKKYGQTIISLLQMLSEPHWAPGTLGFVGKINTRRIVMISTYKKTTIKWAVAALVLVLVAGCSSLNNPINPANSGQNEKPGQEERGTNNQQNNNSGTPSSPTPPVDAKSIVYQNARYGFIC